MPGLDIPRNRGNQNNAERQMSPHELYLEKQKMALSARKKQMARWVQSVQGETGGLFGKSVNLAGLNPESLTGAMLTLMLLYILNGISQEHFFLMCEKYDEALGKQENYEYEDGTMEVFSLAYVPNANGIFPPIYPLDPDTMEPDYTQDPVDHQIALKNPALIIGNGYVPEPDYVRSLLHNWWAYEEAMYGPSILSPEQTLDLHGAYNGYTPAAKAHGNKSASDLAAVQGMTPNRPAPTPTRVQ